MNFANILKHLEKFSILLSGEEGSGLLNVKKLVCEPLGERGIMREVQPMV